MADVHEPDVRSYNMSQIKGKNTKPEMIVRKFLFGNGLRYRLHDTKLPGKPDIILTKYKTVLFVNGCFWHGHNNCRFATIPKTRQDWWLAKISRTAAKDLSNEKQLIKAGWNVITIWECDLKKDQINDTLSNLLISLTKNLSAIPQGA